MTRRKTTALCSHLHSINAGCSCNDIIYWFLKSFVEVRVEGLSSSITLIVFDGVLLVSDCESTQSLADCVNSPGKCFQRSRQKKFALDFKKAASVFVPTAIAILWQSESRFKTLLHVFILLTSVGFSLT